jgi:UDP-glucose 4-epimerase
MDVNFVNKRVAIIGSNGYLGSSLVQELVKIGCSVIRVSKLHNQSIAGTISITGNMMDPNFCGLVVKNSDIIYFLSGNTSIREAAENPEKNYNSTVTPIINIIETSKQMTKVPKLIFASTATVYGLTPNQPIAENFPADPKTIYDEHKFLAEKSIESATKSGILQGTSIRLSNVYGPSLQINSSNDRGIVNKAIIQAMCGKSLTVFGTGEYVRDYIYISDVISAFVNIGGQKNFSHNLLNVGSGVGTTIKDLYATIANTVKIKTRKTISLEFHSFPSHKTVIDERNFTANISRISSATGWYPKYDLKRGIESFIDSVLLCK